MSIMTRSQETETSECATLMLFTHLGSGKIGASIRDIENTEKEYMDS